MIKKLPLVLIVEDELELGAMLAEWIATYGIETAHLRSGNQALTWLRRHQPDVIISDVQMPDGTGVELLAQVRSEKKDVPFYFISGAAGISKSDAERMGVSGFYRKPEGVVELVAKIVQLLFDKQNSA